MQARSEKGRKIYGGQASKITGKMSKGTSRQMQRDPNIDEIVKIGHNSPDSSLLSLAHTYTCRHMPTQTVNIRHINHHCLISHCL